MTADVVLLEALLQNALRRADQAESTLREWSELEGDPSLWRLVTIWREAAEIRGTRMVLAERCVRLLAEGKPAGAEVAAWRKEAGEG